LDPRFFAFKELQDRWSRSGKEERLQLEMTESEICHRFKRNGGGKRMIPILAQLNAVDDDVIWDILWRNDLLKEKPKFMHKYQYC